MDPPQKEAESHTSNEATLPEQKISLEKHSKEWLPKTKRSSTKEKSDCKYGAPATNVFRNWIKSQAEKGQPAMPALIKTEYLGGQDGTISMKDSCGGLWPGSVGTEIHCMWADCLKFFLSERELQEHIENTHVQEVYTHSQWEKQHNLVNEQRMKLRQAEDILEFIKSKINVVSPGVQLSPVKNDPQSARIFSGIESLAQAASLSDGCEAHEKGGISTLGTLSMSKSPQVFSECIMSSFKMEPSDLGKDIDMYRYKKGKPPFSYASLIGKALMEASGNQLTLNGIYLWISKNFPYFSMEEPLWKNAVRRNLSLHQCFLRTESSHGAFWKLDSDAYRARKTKCRPHDTSEVDQ